MNENKTAITEMREWLEIETGRVASIDRSGDTWAKEILATTEMEIYGKVAAHARRLESSQAEKDKGLVEALEKLARLGNGDEYGNSDGNRIAQEALARHKASDKGVK